MITILPRVTMPGRPILRRLSPAQVLPERIAVGHLQSAKPDPGILKAANHLGQGPLDLLTRVGSIHLERAVQVFSLLSEPHQNRPQFGWLQPDKNLPVPLCHRRLQGVKNLLTYTLRNALAGTAICAKIWREPNRSARPGRGGLTDEITPRRCRHTRPTLVATWLIVCVP